jgi:hypothetical protein
VDAETEPGCQSPARCVVRVDDRREAAQAELAGCHVQARACGLGGKPATLRVPGKDVTQLDLVPLRLGMQPGEGRHEQSLGFEVHGHTGAR